MKGLTVAIILAIVAVGLIDCSPSQQCKNGQRYPHPKGCKSYYYCLSGQLFELTCERGYEFSTEERKCLSEDEVNCEARTTNWDTTTTTYPPTTTTEEPCEDYQKFPHETKCDGFYLCLGGNLYEDSCPKPLHYNDAIQECDFQENANCQIFTTTVGAPCENFRYYPHPLDCRKYYQCLNEDLYLMECPKNLAFNPVRESCDYPSLANCPTMPAKCEEYKKYPHEVECSKYYYCLDEVLFLMSCNEELHFNWVRQDCDLKENAMCEIETRK